MARYQQTGNQEGIQTLSDLLENRVVTAFTFFKKPDNPMTITAKVRKIVCQELLSVDMAKIADDTVQEALKSSVREALLQTTQGNMPETQEGRAQLLELARKWGLPDTSAAS